MAICKALWCLALLAEKHHAKTSRYHHNCFTWCIGFIKAFLLAYEYYDLKPFPP